MAYWDFKKGKTTFCQTWLWNQMDVGVDFATHRKQSPIVWNVGLVRLLISYAQHDCQSFPYVRMITMFARVQHYRIENAQNSKLRKQKSKNLCDTLILSYFSLHTRIFPDIKSPIIQTQVEGSLGVPLLTPFSSGWQTLMSILTSSFTEGEIFFLGTQVFILKCKDDNDCSIKKSTCSL